MGRISDAIADVEEQLEAEIHELEEALGLGNDKIDRLKEEVDDLALQLKDCLDYIEWAESFYPEMANQYGAINKVRG
jgi:chromosome segregation ATPase